MKPLNLGTLATVVFDKHTHDVTTLQVDEREGLREVAVFPGLTHEFYVRDAIKPGVDNMVLPLDSANLEEPLVDEIQIACLYTLHVAVYALQQIAAETGTPYSRIADRALELIGTSGDCEEHFDPDTFRPMPVEKPDGWDA